MNHQVQLKRTDRIAEYFMVVSCGSQLVPLSEEADTLTDETLMITLDSLMDDVLTRILITRFETFITDRYPEVDRTDSRLPEALKYFCLPNGLRLSLSKGEDLFHSFVHTSEDGSHMLGCCLTFYEEMSVDQFSSIQINFFRSNQTLQSLLKLYVPKCICVISSWPFVSSFKKFLVAVHKMVTLESNAIPIERYICNLIDDVPAPPTAGNVDILYYINDVPLSFRCPAMNEPHIWREGTVLPLFPLFECLSPENICCILSLALTERQILFVSSQLSLLTIAAEAITSLIFPLTWSHPYIPILPYQLLGVLGAPVPFIIGIHADVYEQAEKGYLSPETYRILLDDNVVLNGSQGPPIPLPERRYRKLLDQIATAAPVFQGLSAENDFHPSIKISERVDHVPHAHAVRNAGSDDSSDRSTVMTRRGTAGSTINTNMSSKATKWRTQRLPYYDNANSAVSENVHAQYCNTYFEEDLMAKQKATLVSSERQLRDGFLKFFVSLLKDYKKYLIYGTPAEPDPIMKFGFEDFLASQPSDWRPFLQVMVDTQAFSQFVDERVLHYKKNQDVVFFDESIDAKMNRYTIRKIFNQTTDTPFLSDKNVKTHIKTYVPLSPDTSNLPSCSEFKYTHFPELNSTLFSKPRNVKTQFAIMDRCLNQIRFKRKNTAENSDFSQLGSSLNGTGWQPSAMKCIYSCYMVILSQYIISSENSRSRSSESYSNGSSSFSSSCFHRSRKNTCEDDVGMDEEKKQLQSYNLKCKNAAKLALKTVFEVLNCLSRVDHSPDEIVYRYIADACGACGEPAYLIDLLVYMDDEGLTPDHQILHSLAKALALARIRMKVDEMDGVNSKDGASGGGGSGSKSNTSSEMTVTLEEQLLSLYTTRSGGAASLRNGGTNTNSNNISRADVQFDIRKLLSPTEVWNVTNWRRYYNPMTSIVYLRKSSPQSTPLQAQPSTTDSGPIPTSSAIGNPEDSAITRLLFGPSSLTSSSAIVGKNPSEQANKLPPPPPIVAANGTIPLLSESSSSKNKWSINYPIEGCVPNLKWSFKRHLDEANANNSKNGIDSISNSKSKYSYVYAASKKLHRLLRISESLLDDFAYELSIDFHSPFGTICPGKNCPVKRSLTVGEIHQGWELINRSFDNSSSNYNDSSYYSTGNSNSTYGNAASVDYSGLSPTKLTTDLSNKYTTKCIHCGTEFLPRFQVIYKTNPQRGMNDDVSISTSPMDDGSEITSVWCEFLSPWVVTKEILNILYSTDESLMQKGDDDESVADGEDGVDINRGDLLDGTRLLSKLFVHVSTNQTMHSASHRNITTSHSYRHSTSINKNNISAAQSQLTPITRGRQRTLSSAKLQQRAVIFWNMLVAFRLRGLPFGFLLANNAIFDSFPPPPSPA